MIKKHYECLHGNLYRKKHESGLNIFIMPDKKSAKYYGALGLRYGSIDCRFIPPYGKRNIITPDATAFFIQNIISMQYQNNLFRKYGVDDSLSNSYTTFTNTIYEFTASDNLNEYMSVLLYSVFNPRFCREDLDTVRKNLNRKIRIYQDNAGLRVRLNLLNCLYLNFPVKYKITGNTDSQAEVNTDILYKCFNYFYRPSNCVLFIAGDVTLGEISDIADNYIPESSYDMGYKPVRIYPHEPAKLNLDYFEQKMDIQTPRFAIGIKDIDTGYSGKALLKKEIEILILLDLLFGCNSDFYNENRVSGLINSTFKSSFTGEKYYGYILLSGESSEPVKVFEQVKRYLKKGGSYINEQSVDDIKGKLECNYGPNYNYGSYIGSNIVPYYLKSISFQDFQYVLSGISEADLKLRFNINFSGDLAAISVLCPD